MSRTNITSTIISTDYSKGGTGNSKIGGTGRFFQGGGGGTRNGSNKENERNNKTYILTKVILILLLVMNIW